MSTKEGTVTVQLDAYEPGTTEPYTVTPYRRDDGTYEVVFWRASAAWGFGYKGIAAADTEAAIAAALPLVRAEIDTRYAPAREREARARQRRVVHEATEAAIAGGAYDHDAVVVAYKCPECEFLHEDEPELDPRYNCGNCGNLFSASESEGTHRCSQCNMFAAKEAMTTCPHCQEGVDAFDAVNAVEVDGTLYEAPS